MVKLETKGNDTRKFVVDAISTMGHGNSATYRYIKEHYNVSKQTALRIWSQTIVAGTHLRTTVRRKKGWNILPPTHFNYLKSVLDKDAALYHSEMVSALYIRFQIFYSKDQIRKCLRVVN